MDKESVQNLTTADIPLETISNASGSRAFPKDDIDPDIKEGTAWNCLVAEGIWGNRGLYGANLFFNGREEYAELLKWALGRQSETKYKPFLGVKEDSNDKTWVAAINWKIKNYITKRINIVIAKILSNQYDVEVENINPIAIDSKEDYKARMQFVYDHPEFFQALTAKAGISPGALVKNNNGPSMPELPQSQEDIDLFFDLDYKTIEEIGMELGIKHHLKRNKYNDLIRGMCNFDCFVYGVMGIYDGMDENIMPAIERCDPADLIVPFSKTPDWSSLPYVGQVIMMTVAEFRKSASGYLSPEVIDECINKHSRIPEPGIDYSNDLIRYTDIGRIAIMRYNYRSTDMVAGVRKKDEAGNNLYYEKDFDYFGPQEKLTFDTENGKRKLYRKPVNTVYEGYWVVNSKHVYRQGRRGISMRKRGSLSEDLMGYKIIAPNAWMGQITPMMGQVSATLDELQKYNLKLQQLVGAAIPKGGFIDLDALRAAKLKWNKKDMSDQEKVEMFMMTGWGLNSSKNRHAPGSSYKGPFTEAENGMARDVLNLGVLITNKLIELDEILGLNKASSASTLSPEAGKGVTQQQQDATDTALDWIVKADKKLHDDVCESVAINHIKSIKYGPKEYYDRVFGRMLTGILYSKIPFDNADFGFHINVRPTREEWNNLKMEAYKMHDDGKGMLTYSQLLRLEEFQSLKQARRYLANCEKKALEEMQAQKESDIQANAQAQQESLKMKSETIIAEEKAKQDTVRITAKEERETLTWEYNLKTQSAIAIAQNERGLLPGMGTIKPSNLDQAPTPTPALEKSADEAQLQDSLKE